MALGKLEFVPKVWGQGQTFGLSGLEKETDWFNPFVGQTLQDPVGILFHAGQDSSLDFQLRFGGETKGLLLEGRPENTRPHVVGPDLLDLGIEFSSKSNVRFRLAWVNRMSVLGEAQGRDATPILLTKRCAPLGEKGPILVVPQGEVEEKDGSQIVRLPDRGIGRFAVVCGSDPGRIASTSLEADLESILSEYLDFYNRLRLPNTDDESVLKTYVKACAIMKVNVETASGEITNRWTTPDRWPHRHMWLWDSAFHSLGAQHLDVGLGRDCIRSVLTKQKRSGFIPHTMAPDPEQDSSMTQPPVLAWATWELNSQNPDKNFLAEVYPGLKEYIAWDLTNMDRLGTGLLQWQFAGPDSGMDNSPRFDDGPDFDAVDLNCFIVMECQRLELIANEIGLDDEGIMWQKLGRDLTDEVNNRLWDEERGFYFDRRKNGLWIDVKTVDHFLPLFSGVATDDRARILIEDHLMNEKEFWPEFPVPSVALNEPTFELDMWRGPTWINYNWLIICGLRRYGYEDSADKLMDITIAELCKWRAERGSIYEFYDPFSRKAPQDLKRKGRIRRWPGNGIPVISDYFWSASVFVNMAAKKYGLSKSS